MQSTTEASANGLEDLAVTGKAITGGATAMSSEVNWGLHGQRDRHGVWLGRSNEATVRRDGATTTWRLRVAGRSAEGRIDAA